MTAVNMLWAFLIATAFVGWPIIGKYAGAGGQWVTTTVLVGSTLVGIGFSLPALRQQPLPSFTGFALMMIAGLVNGYAVYEYSLKTSDSAIPTGTFIAVMTIMMVVLGMASSAVLTHETVSLRQMGGVALAVLAIWLIAGH